MSDTPETDSFFWRQDIDWNDEVHFARKLERERDAARKQRDELAEALRHAVRFVRCYESTSTSAMDDKWATEEEAELAFISIKKNK